MKIAVEWNNFVNKSRNLSAKYSIQFEISIVDTGPYNSILTS